MDNCIRSRDFINWYNAHPDFRGYGEKNLKFWDKIKHVAVIGHGNVALDVARILAACDGRLRESDIDREYEEFRKRRKIQTVKTAQNFLFFRFNFMGGEESFRPPSLLKK